MDLCSIFLNAVNCMLWEPRPQLAERTAITSLHIARLMGIGALRCYSLCFLMGRCERALYAASHMVDNVSRKLVWFQLHGLEGLGKVDLAKCLYGPAQDECRIHGAIRLTVRLAGGVQFTGNKSCD